MASGNKHSPSHIFHGSFINMTDTCQENLSARHHAQWDVPFRTPKASECTVKYLVNAFLLVHHPSAHRTKRALPFSTLQWSQTQETLSFTAALCRRARRGWAREERSGRRRKWRRERERGRGREGERQSCLLLPQLPWFYLSLHLPHFITLVCPHLIFNKRTTEI